MEIEEQFDTNIVKKVKIQMYFCEKYYDFFVKPSAIRLITFKKPAFVFSCPDKTINLNNMPRIKEEQIILNFKETKEIAKILSYITFQKFSKISKFEMEALYSIKFLGYEFIPCFLTYYKFNDKNEFEIEFKTAKVV